MRRGSPFTVAVAVRGRGRGSRSRSRSRSRFAVAVRGSRSRFAVVTGRTRGSILVAVLWCVVLLALIVIPLLHAERIELRLARNTVDQIQAHYLALAGIEKAKAVISDELERLRTAKQRHSARLDQNSADFGDTPLATGRFRIIRAGDPAQGESALVHGVVDESSFIDLNQAAPAVIARLPGCDAAIAAAIADWRDADRRPNEGGGAEVEDYAALSPPYLPSDDALLTLREALQVRGVNPERFLGEDANANGLLDPSEDDGERSWPPDNQNHRLDAGWSALVTLEASADNAAPDGTRAVHIQIGRETALAEVDGVSTSLASAIVAYRERKPLKSISDLLSVRAVRPAGAPATPQNEALSTAEGAQSAAGGNSGQDRRKDDDFEGEPLISEALLKRIASGLTDSFGFSLEGRVNINTAPAVVLRALEGMTPEIAEAIVAHRRSAGFFENVAHLLDVIGVTREVFATLCSQVTTHSSTFRVVAEGKVAATGARRRIQATVRFDSFGVDTLAWREEP